MLIHEDAADFQTVASPGVATLDLQVKDVTYISGVLHYQESGSDVTVANMRTAITQVELLINNVTQWKLTGTQMLAFMEAMGMPPANGYIDLPFSLPRLPDPAREEAMAMGTGNLNSMQLKVTLASGRTAPTLAFYYRGRAESKPLGNIIQLESDSVSVTSTSAPTKILNQEERGRSLVGFFLNSTDVASVSYFQGQRRLFKDYPVAVINRDLTKHDRLAPVSGWSNIIFPSNGQFGVDLMPIIVRNSAGQAVRLPNQTLELNMGATGTVEFFVALFGLARG